MRSAACQPSILPSLMVDRGEGAGEVRTVGVVGAGTMGAGIAQAAAQSGLATRLYDLEERFVARGRDAIESSLSRFVDRGRLPSQERDAALGRLSFGSDLAAFADCDFVIEAAPETLDVKLDVFKRLQQICPPHALLASNTSSLSVTEIARGTDRPDRVVGMHFFNPPVLMKLVEVVRGEASSAETIEMTVALARRLGKVPVTCIDTPGFIVNRVARPFYLEGLRMFGEGQANVEDIDAALRAAGFPMGPFQLMDLIGIDVNFSVTKSVYEQRFHEARFRPHLAQQALLRAGRLGRKTGSGFYDYAVDPPRSLAVRREGGTVEVLPFDWTRWQALTEVADQAPIAARAVSAIVNEAYFAVGEGVASPSDVDTAMKLGTNYPKGPFEWAEELGLELVVDTLWALEDWYRDGLHAPAPLLRQRALQARPALA